MIRKAVGAIISCNQEYIIIHKVKMNINDEKQSIDGEWDFVKGGVEEHDLDLQNAILRELKEETGSCDYKIINQLDEKIHFQFPLEIQSEIGYQKQEITMFHVEFYGDKTTLKPIDDEIKDIKFLQKREVLTVLTHKETRDYFVRHFG
ncbi:NUDIX domain-containing protein [Aquibacillus rhizosphaerae]|uniref:NUDIX hydrolase n=1 Tax=Aquibacillus rhizosphaerae TaxID=3051431 RepID=A0ABT7L1J4_9BACI|nr:NUDIX hydrolase [Aquibacillus sp. LR5S19]MDL4839724.1 NUDIX hydrolase [Aquibacillus sp. LR5S19]